MTIRPFTSDDYPAVAEIATRTRPDLPMTAESLAYDDANRADYLKFGRWVAENDAGVIGFATHTQYADLYDPQALWVSVRVHPDHQRRGVGSALYDHLLHAVQVHNPQKLLTAVQEHQPHSVAFAQKRGFAEYARRWSAVLDVAAANPEPYREVEADLARQGITLKSVADLASDAAWEEKLWRLAIAIETDVPISEPVTPLGFEQYRQMVLADPYFVPEGSFVAVHGNEYIGLMMVTHSGSGLYIDLTGVHRDYRRKRIALALKVKGIAFARIQGYQKITVTNDPVNTGMLAINTQLGYVRQPALLSMAKYLREA